MEQPKTNLSLALKRGFRCKCPSCGESSTFRAYLKVHEKCLSCEAKLGHFRSDDLPPYLTIFLVGHIVVPILLWIEKTSPQPLEFLLPMALVATTILTLAFLPLIKGAVIGLMWHLDRQGSLYN